MLKGVTLQNPRSTRIDTETELAADVTIEGGCHLVRAKVEKGAIIESGCRLVDTRVGAGAHIKQGSYLEKSDVGSACSVGPYAHLRPGSVLSPGVRIGNFVELKNSRFGEGSKANHLSYVGDAEVGRDVNIGCGFVTCNYDGFAKHRTVIEDGVFIGSDSQTVAPVRLGAGSYVSTGTTITQDVPPGALAISRGRQVNKPGYAARIREKKTPTK